MSSALVSKVFRGDHEDLLDHLVFACNEHKTRSAAQPIRERELVPFFTPGEELAPLPTKNWQSCGSPPRSSSGKARKGGVASPGRAAARGSNKPRASTDLPAVRAPRTRTCGGSLCGTVAASPVGSSSSLGTPLQVSTRTSFTSLGSSPPAACPAFFSSPKPEVLPMPTTGLLSRAGTIVRAERSPAVAPVCGFAIPTAAA